MMIKIYCAYGKYVAWYISISDTVWSCFRVEFQPVIDYSDTATKLLEHKVTVLNVC